MGWFNRQKEFWYSMDKIKLLVSGARFCPDEVNTKSHQDVGPPSFPMQAALKRVFIHPFRGKGHPGTPAKDGP